MGLHRRGAQMMRGARSAAVRSALAHARDRRALGPLPSACHLAAGLALAFISSGAGR